LTFDFTASWNLGVDDIRHGAGGSGP
jgi:hypothetical protein